MKTEKIYNEVLEKIKKEASGFVGASIVDMESGMPLATQSTRDDFDLGTASAYNSEMVKMKLKTMEILGLNRQLEDMLLTLSDHIHLVKIIDANSFLYLACEKASSNLGIVRSAVNRHVASLK